MYSLPDRKIQHRKSIAGLLASCLLVVALLLRTTTVNIAKADEAPPTETARPRIRLGAIVPLSGPLAFFGKDYVRAYELLKAEVPEIESFIDIRWEDSAYDSKQAVSAFNKLVSVDRVDIVFSFGGPMLNVLAPVAESRKIPFFASESEKRDCEGREYCSLFRNEEDEWGHATWSMLRKRNMRRVGIVKNQNQFMNTFVSAIERVKNEYESVEILLDLSPETSDLRTSMLSLKTREFDALGVYFLPNSHHGFLDSLKLLKKPVPMFGLEEFLVEEHNKGFENTIEGTLVIAPYATEAYRTLFEKTHGRSAGFYYTPAFYDFVTLLKDSMKANQGLRGLELVKAMHFQGTREGVSGRYAVKLSANGVHSYSFPIGIYRVTKAGLQLDDAISFINH